MSDTATRFRSLHCLIGQTPLLSIDCRYRGRDITVHAKFEVRNFTGSIKDRMALRILEDAHNEGALAPGPTIVEATSGNTGISFAAVGRALGHDVRIFMPDWMSRERVASIRSLGAEVVPVSHEQGGFLGAIAMADTFAHENGSVFLPHQFDSSANVEAHHGTTAPELLKQLREIGEAPTAFVAGVGTGGTVMGVGFYLREHVPGITIHPLEPANSPTLRTGEKVGKHRIQGISDEFVPSIVHLDEVDDVVDVWDGDAIVASQMLGSKLGLGVGISSGANLLGALQVAYAQGDGAVVATVFPDSNKKYFSTDLSSDEPLEDHYHCADLDLVGCRVTA